MDHAGYAPSAGDMDMGGVHMDDQNAPQVENVDESGLHQQPEGGENENVPPEAENQPE